MISRLSPGCMRALSTARLRSLCCRPRLRLLPPLRRRRRRVTASASRCCTSISRAARSCPAASDTVSSPNLGRQTASNYFTMFLNKYNFAIPGWKGVEVRRRLGDLIKTAAASNYVS